MNPTGRGARRSTSRLRPAHSRLASAASDTFPSSKPSEIGSQGRKRSPLARQAGPIRSIAPSLPYNLRRLSFTPGHPPRRLRSHRQISINGGSEPKWCGAGRKCVYWVRSKRDGRGFARRPGRLEAPLPTLPSLLPSSRTMEKEGRTKSPVTASDFSSMPRFSLLNLRHQLSNSTGL
jgi:hypothetical protein